MTKETVPPPMYPTPSRRGGRGGTPGNFHRPTPQFQQQRPVQPSNAAAKAAAAAKAFQRRVIQERAKAKQQEEEKHRTSSDNSQSSAEQRNDVFRRSPNQEADVEGQNASGGSILKKMMTKGQSYRVGPASEDGKYEAEPSSSGAKRNVVVAATAPPSYPPGHPSTQYQHYPHMNMMYGHPNPYGHPHHYSYAHPHYHHPERQNASNPGDRKSSESSSHPEGTDTSPKNDDPNRQQHYYAPNYHHGHHYPMHPYYDGRNYSSYPQYHVQHHHPPPSPPPPHQFYNPNHRGPVLPPGGNSSAADAKTTEDGTSSNSSSAPSGPPLEEQQFANNARGSTRHIIGSHTSIHVPRAMLESDKIEKSGLTPLDETLPLKPRDATIFRSAEDNEGHDLIESTEILLSLSKSFDRGEGVNLNHNQSIRGRTKKSTQTKKAKSKKDVEAAPSTPSKNHSGERPKSPDDPPRIHHFHKQTNDCTFEPQPSPIKMDPNDIELAPSFQLFNQSFDMNLENLIGPNASFGLGPMKSLSFGLGLSNPSDIGASPRASPISIHNARMSPRVAADAVGVGNVDFGIVQPKLEDGMSNLQVLRASPSNSFGNVIVRRGSLDDIRVSKDGSSSVIVLGDSARVGTIHAADHGQLSPFRAMPQNSPNKRKNDQREDGGSVKKSKQSNAKRKKTPHKIDSSLFQVLERHHSMFTKFLFLLPGAKAIIDERCDLKKSKYLKLSKNDEEVARRRINSALCAFGGVVNTPLHSIGATKTEEEQKYENSLPYRYYEDENRLSWEIEENPPVHLDSEEDEQNADDEEDKRGKSKPPKAAALQRAIGVMVYPAVNAFTAAEPGVMTPALDEMNNFVDSPSRSTPSKGETLPCEKQDQSLPLVSPDYVKTPQRSINYAGGAWMSNHQSPVNVTPGKDIESPTDLLFVDTQELLPEQYRTVNCKKTKRSSSQYVYPALPLSYGQRKRISNAMFAMSKSIPGLTDECALVLGEARQNENWDVVVAQLMTQVVVLTHCSVEDSRLDGLSKYLLTLGIAA